MSLRIGKLIAIGALLLAGLLTSAADAATLYISEFPNGMSQVGTTSPQVYPQASIADQTVAISGASASSAAFNARTHAVLMMCDIGCSVSFATSPTATTSNFLLQQGRPYQFIVVPGQKVAAIANTAGNTPSGGGGAVTIADGADVTEGAIADAAVAAGAAGTVSAKLRTLTGQLGGTGTLASIGSITTAITPGTASANLGKAEDAVAGSGDTGVMALCVQTATPVDTAADGDYANCQLKNGGLFTTEIPNTAAGAGITPVVSAALESNHVIKNSAGNLYAFSVTTGATAGWVLISNSTTAPTAGGAAIAPLGCYIAAANSTLGVTLNPPLAASTGITIVFSSSGCLTNTASATTFIAGYAK